jgi:hypothetical protein
MTINWQSSKCVVYIYNKVVLRIMTPATVFVIVSESIVSLIVMKFLINGDNQNFLSPGVAFVFALAVPSTGIYLFALSLYY